MLAVVTAFLALFCDRRLRAVRPAALLSVLRQGARLDAAAGHLGQRLQQDHRRARVRLHRRPARRSRRPAPADARRHPHGRRRADRPVVRHAASPRSICSTASTRSDTSAAARCPTRCCSRAGSTGRRGKAMGVAYLGIGLGGAIVPLLAFALTQTFGWRGALRSLASLMIADRVSGRVLRARASRTPARAQRAPRCR